MLLMSFVANGGAASLGAARGMNAGRDAHAIRNQGRRPGRRYRRLPNGGEGGQAAEAAAETTSAERDSRTLDYLITVIGFGLCRAWIVFCWARRSSQAQHHLSPGLPLVRALSALTVSFVANRSGKREGVVRVALFRATPVALAASGIIIPVALALNSEALMIVGFVAGGLERGPCRCCGATASPATPRCSPPSLPPRRPSSPRSSPACRTIIRASSASR